MPDDLVPEIDIHELETQLANGAPVVDVREPHEHSEAHITGVVLIPLESVPERIAEIPAAGPVYVVCAMGGRSHHAAAFLRRQGIDAINVSGGTKAWIEAGKPVEAG